MRDSFLVFGSPIIEEPEIQNVIDAVTHVLKRFAK
jgi:hypothetical protein